MGRTKDAKEVSEQSRKDPELEDGGLHLQGLESIWGGGGGQVDKPASSCLRGWEPPSSLKCWSCFGNRRGSTHPVPATAPQLAGSGGLPSMKENRRIWGGAPRGTYLWSQTDWNPSVFSSGSSGKKTTFLSLNFIACKIGRIITPYCKA